MAFWLGIIIAGAAAWSAVKMGLYQMWAIFFNLMVAVYLAVHLRPFISELAGQAGATRYCDALCILATAVVVFAALHLVTSALLLGTFNVSLPRFIDVGGSALLGFLAGYLVWSFAGMLICTTPLCRLAFVREAGFDNTTFQQANMYSYVLWWCNLMDRVVAPRDRQQASREAMEEVLRLADKRLSPRKASHITEPNEPNQPPTPEQPRGQAPETAPTVIPP